MVRPDDETQESEHHRGVDHRLVSPQRLPGVTGNHLGDDRDRRKNQNIHLGVSEKPEEVLEEKRTTAPGRVEGHPVDVQTGRDKETGPAETIHQRRLYDVSPGQHLSADSDNLACDPVNLFICHLVVFAVSEIDEMADLLLPEGLLEPPRSL